MNAPSNNYQTTAKNIAANIGTSIVDTPDTETQGKEEVLRWIFAITGAIIIFLLLAAVGLNIYHPDLQALHNLADNILFEGGAAMPEPMEALLFRLGIITVVPATIALYALSSRSSRTKWVASSKSFQVISIAVICILIALIYFDFAAGNPFSQQLGNQTHSHRDKTGKSNFDFYFDGFFMGDYVVIYMLALLPLILYLFYFGLRKYNWDRSKLFKTSTTALLYLLLSSCVISVIAMNTFQYPYTNDNKLDFNAVYFSMTQVHAGLPMLVNHFTNTYAFTHIFSIHYFVLLAWT